MPGNVTPRKPSKLVAALLAVGSCMGVAHAQTVFYSENFDSAVLTNRSSDPDLVQACSANEPRFTHVPPAGWNNDLCGISTYYCRNSGTCGTFPGRIFSNCNNCTLLPATTFFPGGNPRGVFEWEGWSFVRKSWWVQTAGDQRRSEFALGSGNVAVADPDEWDDQGDPKNSCGDFNAFMTSPVISLVGQDLNSLSLNFASAWRPEGFDDGPSPQINNQTATIEAIYTVNGVEQAPVTVLKWDSDPSGPFFKGDATNEAVSIAASTLAAPAGATSVKFRFGLSNAMNDWYWAIDNVNLTAGATTLFLETFDGVTLINPVDEIPTGCGVTFCGQNVYTHNSVNGVDVIVDSPALDPAGANGVADWRGWSFITPEFFACKGGTNAAQFLSGTGKIAIANSDAFDNVAVTTSFLDTTLRTPVINIASRTANTLILTFNSNWRRSGAQSAAVYADYANSSGPISTQQVLFWDSSSSSPNFKPSNFNEAVAAPLLVPAGATSVRLRFAYTGSDDWWWAIDNLSVFQGAASVTYVSASPASTSMALASTFNSPLCSQPWGVTPPTSWNAEFNLCGNCPGSGFCGVPEFSGWSFVSKQWWIEVQGDQQRSEFTRGTGRIAVADPDAWDDIPNGQTVFNAFVTTPAIALTSGAPTVLSFDSAWRPEGFDDGSSCASVLSNENNQTGTIEAIYTVGGVEQAPVTVLRWDSDPGDSSLSPPRPVSPFYKPDNAQSRNERVSLSDTELNIPAGASSVKFRFGVTKSRNDWYWAIDNLNVSVNSASVFSENFENVENLQGVITQAPAVADCRYFSTISAQPGNFTVNNAGLVGCNNPDFTGFNAFATSAWAKQFGGLRAQYGTPTAYISDFQSGQCSGQAYMLTPAYPTPAVNANSLQLSFRSGWLNAPGHVSTVEVSFDGGSTWSNRLTWNTSNKPTSTDETVTVQLNNPPGVQSVQVRFGDRDAGWWALSNITISGTVGSNQTACPADTDGNGLIEVADIFGFLSRWFAGDTRADIDGNTQIEVADIFAFLSRWFSGC